MFKQRKTENDPISAPRAASQRAEVIGGSAAGLFTAWLLARRGISVRVFERIETLEPAARTLIVTQRMRGLLGAAAEGSIINEIRRFELFTDGRAATIALKQPDLIIERRALIQGLAARSAAGRRKDRTRPPLSRACARMASELTSSKWNDAPTATARRFTPIRLSAAMAHRAAWRARPDGRRSKRFRFSKPSSRCRKTWRRTPCASGSFLRTRLISTG